MLAVHSPDCKTQIFTDFSICQDQGCSENFVLGRYKILGRHKISSTATRTLLLLHKKFTWPDFGGIPIYSPLLCPHSGSRGPPPVAPRDVNLCNDGEMAVNGCINGGSRYGDRSVFLSVTSSTFCCFSMFFYCVQCNVLVVVIKPVATKNWSLLLTFVYH